MGHDRGGPGASGAAPIVCRAACTSLALARSDSLSYQQANAEQWRHLCSRSEKVWGSGGWIGREFGLCVTFWAVEAMLRTTLKASARRGGVRRSLACVPWACTRRTRARPAQDVESAVASAKATKEVKSLSKLGSQCREGCGVRQGNDQGWRRDGVHQREERDLRRVAADYVPHRCAGGVEAAGRAR